MEVKVVVEGVGVAKPSSDSEGELGILPSDDGFEAAGSDWIRFRALSAPPGPLSGASSRGGCAGDGGFDTEMLFPLTLLGDGGTTVTFGPESRLSKLGAALSCAFRGDALAVFPFACSTLLLGEPAELTLIDGFRLGVGEWGDDCVLELREWWPEGFTSFEKNPGAIMLSP